MTGVQSPEYSAAVLLRKAGFPPGYRSLHPWLPHLLHAYQTLDQELQKDIYRDGRVPACLKGCSFCCKQHIPITPPEATALRLYIKRYPEAQPTSLGGITCPFLKNDSCSVYGLRPIACRRFIVFNAARRDGESPLDERPQDVLAPSRKALLQTLQMTLPFYTLLGILPKGEADIHFFASYTTLIQQENWKS